MSHDQASTVDYITQRLLPEVESRMRDASNHYGETHRVLGQAGQFADIWRKIGPLKRALWDGADLTREHPRTILMDLIGHCLLTIDMIDHDMPIDGEGIGAMADTHPAESGDGDCIDDRNSYHDPVHDREGPPF